MKLTNYKPPFPWFGGKSRVADLVWQRFGDVRNYVEPFFGSGAVLFLRPTYPQIETINDKDGFVANFWRAVQYDPDAVARYADWPVNENDLHARHAWLVEQRIELTRRLEGDPDYCDAKIAGWWVWGISCWIGSGWCSGVGPWGVVGGKLIKVGNAGRGVNRKLPHLGDAGRGVNRQLPHLGDAGRGVNRQLPHLGDYFGSLADRLRHVRVCCGDWTRVLGPSPTTKLGMTGIFLDPPYGDKAHRANGLYAIDSLTLADDVRAWCLQNGNNPMLRICVCGYEGEHDVLAENGWGVVAWKAMGGYGSQGQWNGRKNSQRERMYFSPACINVDDGCLL